MLVKVFPSGPFLTNAYLLVCEQTRQAAIVDPSPGSFESVKDYLESNNLDCRSILLTHSHWDHIADVKKFKDFYHIPVYVHSLDEPNLKQPGADQLPCWIKIEAVQPDEMLEEGMQVDVGELKLQVLHTPGHSPGCVCFYEPESKILISGDTLFKGSIGNLSFPTSQPDNMWNSLKKLAVLPHETIVYPGHGPSTTIGEESAWLHNAKQLFN